jgi:hypothetical protein
MILSDYLKSKCGSSLTNLELKAEIGKLLDEYKILTNRYIVMVRFSVSSMYAFTEIMQSNDISHIKNIVSDLIAQLPPVDE